MGFLDRVKKGKTSPDESFTAEGTTTAAKGTPPRPSKIEDVLEVLGIPKTFEIPEDVFLAEDLGKVDFSISVPHGLDEAQVTKFVSQMRNSLKFLESLLKKRNEDVARLASVTDKLQVDINNLRFENELASGVSIMPTMDDTDLENQLVEAKMRANNLGYKLKAAESELEKYRSAAADGTIELPTPSGVSEEDYQALRDELSRTQRKLANAEEALSHARIQIDHMEDMAEDELDVKTIREKAPLTEEEYARLGLLSATDDLKFASADPFELPQLDPAPGGSLPGLDDFSLPTPQPTTAAVWDDEEEDELDDFMQRLKEDG